MTTRMETCKYVFTEDELKAKSKQLATANLRISELEDEKKSVMSDFKSKIDRISAEVNLLSNNISMGYDYRQIECDVIPNSPIVGEKEIIRTDNDEIVRVEKMSAAEMQEELHFKEEQAHNKNIKLVEKDEDE